MTLKAYFKRLEEQDVATPNSQSSLPGTLWTPDTAHLLGYPFNNKPSEKSETISRAGRSSHSRFSACIPRWYLATNQRNSSLCMLVRDKELLGNVQHVRLEERFHKKLLQLQDNKIYTLRTFKHFPNWNCSFQGSYMVKLGFGLVGSPRKSLPCPVFCRLTSCPVLLDWECRHLELAVPSSDHLSCRLAAQTQERCFIFS